MKLVSDKDEAESRWGFSFGFGFDQLAETLLENVDEAKAEAIIKEFVSKNSNAESRAFWLPLLGSLLFDKDDAQTRGLWTNFKNCLKDKDDSLSRGIWTDFKACLKDQDDAESRWGFGLSFKWDKLVDTLLEDVDEAKAEAIIKELATTNNAESRGFWTNLLMKLVSDQDDAESRGLWTNFKQCLMDKDDSLSRGI